MNRTEFVIATAIVLFVAFMLGWFANWLVHRMTRVSQADLGELDRLAQMVHEAEEARDEAIAYAQERETELSSELHATGAEYRSAMETLREVRAENESLRAYIDRLEARA
jgi:prophage endopeptidase